MIPRIYCPDWEQQNPNIEVRDDELHYLARVMRGKVGDTVQLFDGLGRRCRAEIKALDKHCARLVAQFEPESAAQPSLDACLLQGLCGADKMDWAIEKAVELGVSAIQVLQTDRSVARLDGTRAENRLAHWQRLAIAACRQSGQDRLPAIAAPVSLAHWLTRTTCAQAERHRLMLSAPADGDHAISISRWQPTTISMRGEAVNAPPAALIPVISVDILVGPESGLSAAETALAAQAGFIAIRLGARVLRTETAGLAALAALQTRFGDF